jgi:hypothetical protein
VALNLLVALLVGVAVGAGHTMVAVLCVAALVVVVAPSLSLAQWCALLLITTIAGRGVSAVLQLPALIGFIHYPASIAFALLAARRPDRTPASRRVGRWLLTLCCVAVVSMAANDSHPLRAALFLVIVGQPLLVLWAILRWTPDQQTLARVRLAALALCAVEVPLAVWQGMAFGWTDPVQGTITGAGNGAHILGALFALVLLAAMAAVFSKRISPILGLAASAVAVGAMVATGANQVIIASALALAWMPSAWPTMGEGTKPIVRSPSFRVGASILTLVVAGSCVLLMQRLDTANVAARTARLVQPGELPEVQMVERRMNGQLMQLVIGSGPGTTASRASLLLAPQMLKETSPLAAIHLPPTSESLQIVSESRSVNGGSAESLASGTLGMVGDLGLAGLAMLVVLFGGIWREIGRAGTWLAPAAKSALVMTAVLLFIDNWLEYPEFAVPLAILLGLGMTPLTDRSG